MAVWLVSTERKDDEAEAANVKSSVAGRPRRAGSKPTTPSYRGRRRSTAAVG